MHKANLTTILFQASKSVIESCFMTKEKHCYVKLKSGGNYPLDHYKVLREILLAITPSLDTDALAVVTEKHVISFLKSVYKPRAMEDVKVCKRVGALYNDAFAIQELFLDVSNNGSKIMKINKDGFEIVKERSINAIEFIGADSSEEINVNELACKTATPKDVDCIREIINPTITEDHFKLLLAWIIYAFFPADFGNKVHLFLHGEGGSGKSSMSDYLLKIIDPNSDGVIDLNKTEDMFVCLDGWLAAFDNFSSLDQKMSDNLCKIATGITSTKRKLCTDGTKYKTNIKSPLIINSIDFLVEREDLRERSIFINFEKCPYKDPEELKRIFKSLKPKLLGAILSILSDVMKDINTLIIPPEYSHIRMTSFLKVGLALEKILGWNNGEFTKAYNANMEVAAETSLPILADVIIRAFNKELPYIDNEFKCLFQENCIIGEPNNIFCYLKAYKDHIYKGQKVDFPENEISLSRRKNRTNSVLKKHGLHLQTPETRGEKRKLIIQRVISAVPNNTL